ncbi:MAG: hypothetical protein RLN72_13190 [Henriciella sp.]
MKGIVPALLLIAIAACGQSDPADTSVSPGEVAAGETPSPDDVAPETVIADAGDPADTLQAWADALQARDWAAARAVWGDSGEASGLTVEEFAAAYEKYKTINIELGEGRMEGAAGTVYYEAPVVIEGELQSGEAYRMEGPVVVSRVNNVPGASTEELEWHIATSDLRPRPVAD